MDLQIQGQFALGQFIPDQYALHILGNTYYAYISPIAGFQIQTF